MYVLKHELVLGGVRVPPFSVRTGEIAQLDWPLPMGNDFEKSLKRVLSQSFALADPFDPELVSIRAAEMPQAIDVLDGLRELMRQRIHEEFCAPIDQMPLTGRTILAVHYACLRRNFVVVSSAGLDPHGHQTLLAFLKLRASRGFGFLLLEYLHTHYTADTPCKVTTLFRFPELL